MKTYTSKYLSHWELLYLRDGRSHRHRHQRVLLCNELARLDVPVCNDPAVAHGVVDDVEGGELPVALWDGLK